MMGKQRQARQVESMYALGRAMIVHAINLTDDRLLREERFGIALDLGAITYDEACELRV